LSDIYRFLAHPRFYEAVAKDERFYSHEMFVNVADILASREWRSRDLIQQFRDFADRVHEFANRCEDEETSADDVPEEFLDALLYTPMRDPVLLPSGQIVDRATIMRHLYSDETDPFTRQPLSEQDLQPGMCACLQCRSEIIVTL
jgi:ubiquitin conjugation factor E4 B